MKKRSGFTLGSIAMLIITAFVLSSFFILLQKITKNVDIHLNAKELAVHVDNTLESWVYDASAVQDTTPPHRPIARMQIEATATVPPQPTQAPHTRLSLSVVGNIRLDATTLQNLTDDGTPNFSILFDSLGDALKADISLATLAHTVSHAHNITNRNMPDSLLPALHEAGLRQISLLHYDLFTSGLQGLANTKTAMRNVGLYPYGAYETQDAYADTPIEDIQGVKVAFLGFQSEMSGASKYNVNADILAYALPALQLPTIKHEIQRVKAQGAEIVVVSLCWGALDGNAPTNTQKQLAQDIANAGADIIIGTHPNALQTVDMLSAKREDGQYHPVLCAYSMGNFFSHDRSTRDRLSSVILQCDIWVDKETKKIAFDQMAYLPTYVWRGREDGVLRQRILLNQQPYPLYVDKTQQEIMGRSLATVEAVMQNSSFR